MEVRKAVIPAAGWGTRFLPATKAVPKELLPLVDRPAIQYVLEEAAAAGITDIVLIISPWKQAIQEHFARSWALEQFLERKGETERLREVRAISEVAHLSYMVQEEQLGLGHAILMARPEVGEEPFAVLLPDDIVDAPVPAIQQLLEVYRRHRCSVVAVERVSRQEVSRYGVIEGELIEDRTLRVRRLVEKPQSADAPSNLAVIGRYILTPKVFRSLQEVEPGAGGEIQLTDGLEHLLRRQPVYAYRYEGLRYDAGTPLDLLKASLRAALRRSDTGEELRRWLQALLSGGADRGGPRRGRRKPGNSPIKA